MMARVITDTGPLVALLSRSDAQHPWVMQQLRNITPPLITCEAVLTEATYLTRSVPGARSALIEMIGDQFLTIGMSLTEQRAAILKMVKRYADMPMSLADACLVRLAELHPQSAVMTFDSDFATYRKNGRQVIELLSPF